MARRQGQGVSAARAMAFALWAQDHAELADDPNAVRASMRCTEPQAHSLIRALREARRRPGRKPKARALRRRAQRQSLVLVLDAQPALLEVQQAMVELAACNVGRHEGELQQQPEVADYVAASVGDAALRAQPVRCGTGHSTCTHAHLGIGPQCEPGACRVNEADAAALAASGVEVSHGQG